MVSVIMPAYNAGKTVRQSVESVMAQTEKEWELIVIDDGSSDDTAEILAEFAAADSRIRFFQNGENRGVSYTRNRAIALAEGEWIAFLDSDDRWGPEKLRKQLALAEEYPEMVVCYTASAFTDETGRMYRYIMPAVEKLTYRTLLCRNLMSCSSVMIRSRVMKQLAMPGDHTHEDYVIWLTVLRSCGVAYGINEPLLIYRLCKNSKSAGRFKSAKMLFCSYRAVGYRPVTAGMLVFRYVFYSVGKRRKIYSSAETKKRNDCK